MDELDSTQTYDNPEDLKKDMDEQETIKICEGHLKEASEYRKAFEADWSEYERFYDGDHWKHNEKNPYVNLIFKTIEYEVPILTDSRPGTDFVAIEEENQDKASVLKEAVDYVYSFNNLDIKLSQGIRETLISTNHYLYVDYDPEKEHGKGQVIIKVLPWRWVYLDPSESEFGEDMSYVVIKRPIKVELLKKQFPFDADDIHAEEITEDTGSDTGTGYIIENRYQGPSGSDYKGTFKPSDMAYLKECWWKDYSMMPIPPEETDEQIEKEVQSAQQGNPVDLSKYLDHATIMAALNLRIEQVKTEAMQLQMSQALVGLPPEAMDPTMQQPQPGIEHEFEMSMLMGLIEQHQALLEQNPQGQKPKYQNNLRLTIWACNKMLYDGNPPVNNGMIPIAPIFCYKREGMPYSFGEVKNILEIQKVYNELFFDEYKNLRLNSNSGWVLDDNSGVDEATLTNEPGIVVKKKAGTEVTRLMPGQVSPQLDSKQQQLKYLGEEISGITEAVQGKRPTGVAAAAAINALQDQAIGRVRLKSRQLEEYTMLRLGKITAAYVLHYWNTGRMLRVYDDNGRIQSLTFDPKELDSFNYDVKTSPGSTFGLSKEALLGITERLMQSGVIDAEIFVMLNDLPFKNTILTKLQERDQMRQQLEMLASENEQLKQLAGPPPQQPGATAPPPPGVA